MRIKIIVMPKQPVKDQNATYILKSDLPATKEWNDIVIMFIICFTLFAIKLKSVSVCWISLFLLISLFLNRKYKQYTAFLENVASILLVLFLLAFLYHVKLIDEIQ